MIRPLRVSAGLAALLALSLLAAAVATAAAAVAVTIPPAVSNHRMASDKATFVGDNLGDSREGGESWGDAVLIGSLPYSDSGATCDNVDDITLPCASSAAPDVVYRFVAASSSVICVSLCGSGYDTALGVYDQNQNNIACNDDFCGLQSEINNIHVTAGQTYYIVVDGYSTNCGSYVLTLGCGVPCQVECPAGSMLEGEPDCYDGYYDTYNSGCNGSGWTTIRPVTGNSAVMCGKSGTYLYNGLSYRDTDWYTCAGIGATMVASCRAEFPLQLIFIYGTDCNNLGYDLTTARVCEDAVLSRFVPADQEVWIWVGVSQFNGIPCGFDYVLTMDGIAPEVVPAGQTSWGAVKSLYR